MKKLFKETKMLLVGILIGATLMSATGAFAAVGDQVQAVFAEFNFVVNGKSVTPSETPLVYNGTSYLPVRSISNLLGYDVTYKADSRTIVLGNSVTGTTYGNVPMSTTNAPAPLSTTPPTIPNTKPSSSPIPSSSLSSSQTLQIGEAVDTGKASVRLYDFKAYDPDDTDKYYGRTKMLTYKVEISFNSDTKLNGSILDSIYVTDSERYNGSIGGIPIYTSGSMDLGETKIIPLTFWNKQGYTVKQITLANDTIGLKATWDLGNY